MGRLQSLGNEFILLHDIEVRKAWLVDGLSALLHLVRAYLTYNHHQNDYATARLSEPEELQAKGGYSGRKVAFETLSDIQNMKLRLYRRTSTFVEGKPDDDSDYYCVGDAIKYILHVLEQIIDHHADERAESSVGYRVRKSPWRRLEGFDFMDIAAKSNLIWPRSTALYSDSEGWVGLTRAIHAVTLFGKGFGELLEPICEGEYQNRCANCHWNSLVPTNRDILAISMDELERIVERRGSKSDNSWRLVDDLRLHFPAELFSACSQNGRRKCRQRILRICQNSEDLEKLEQGKTKFLPGFIARLARGSQNVMVRRPLTENLLTRGSQSDKFLASFNVPSGGILVGYTSNRLRKSAREGKTRETPSTFQQHIDPESLITVTSDSFISTQSSRAATSQDADQSMPSTAASTVLTEPTMQSISSQGNKAISKGSRTNMKA